MLQLAMLFSSPIYAAGGLLFLFNCAAEQIAKGKQPGGTVLLVALAWPAFMVAVIVHVVFAVHVLAAGQ